MLLTLISFLFAIGLLVTVHEYGHYRVAKACGVKVLTFSIGFGRPLLQWQRGETRWQIAMIPLGGFVSMLGENGDETVAPADKSRQFNTQHPLKKMAIVLAGPLANLLLAWLFFSLALLIGVDALKPVAGSVRLDSPAAEAGLRSGDEIIRFDGYDILDWDELRLSAMLGFGSNVQLEVRHGSASSRDLNLDLRNADAGMLDANILSHLGVSPIALMNQIDTVQAGSAADLAGLRAGDKVSAINEVPISNWESLQSMITSNPGKTLQLSVKRGMDTLQLAATPSEVKTARGAMGLLGIAPVVNEAHFAAQQFTLQLNPLEAFQRGAAKAWRISRMTFKMLAQMLTGTVSAESVSGPVGIASMAGESAGLGLSAYLQYLAFVSLSLGILNLLPVPVLDGGHLLYHSAELVRGRPLSASWFIVGQRVGFALLIGLMLLALYNDIHRFIPG